MLLRNSLLKPASPPQCSDDGRRFLFISIVNDAVNIYVNGSRVHVFTVSSPADLGEVTGIIIIMNLMKKHRGPSWRTTAGTNADPSTGGGEKKDDIQSSLIGFAMFQRAS